MVLPEKKKKRRKKRTFERLSEIFPFNESVLLYELIGRKKNQNTHTHTHIYTHTKKTQKFFLKNKGK